MTLPNAACGWILTDKHPRNGVAEHDQHRTRDHAHQGNNPETCGQVNFELLLATGLVVLGHAGEVGGCY
jgi:hypothetical protein